jgi:hypothetical protein
MGPGPAWIKSDFRGTATFCLEHSQVNEADAANDDRLDIEGDIDNRTGLRHKGLIQKSAAMTKTAWSRIAVLPGSQKIRRKTIGRGAVFEFAGAGSGGMRVSKNTVCF